MNLFEGCPEFVFVLLWSKNGLAMQRKTKWKMELILQ